MGFVQSLACEVCGLTFSPQGLRNLCDCGGPLLVRYPLAEIRQWWTRESLANEPNIPSRGMWKYYPVLPAPPEEAVTLGEGLTPLLPLRRLGQRLGMEKLWLKDEGQNPT